MSTPRIVITFLASRRRRRTARELAALSDHQLKDIGITRYDLFALSQPR